jgi:hypothetical protein
MQWCLEGEECEKEMSRNKIAERKAKMAWMKAKQ